MSVAMILLAGGKGMRMGGDTPKQFLPFQEKHLFRHSLDLFLTIPEILEIVVVLDASFQHLVPSNLNLAEPGARRQDSVLSGLRALKSPVEYVAVHDAARPLITKQAVLDVIQNGLKFGASALAVPVKNTVKQVDKNLEVIQTLDRATLFEIQTPQVVKRDVLEKGLLLAEKKGMTLTDDVAAAESLGYLVKLTIGSYQNIKVTTQEDMQFLHLATK